MDRGSYHCIGGGGQNNLKGKKKKDMQEFKVVVCKDFTNSCGKKINKRQRKNVPTECRVPENSKER